MAGSVTSSMSTFTSTKSCSEKFADLIKSRRTGSESLSEESKHVLQDAVFQLVTHHQDIDKLLAEEYKDNPDGRISEKIGKDKNISPHSVLSLVELIKDESRLLSSAVDMVAANICAVKLLQTCSECERDDSNGGNTLPTLSDQKTVISGVIIKAAQCMLQENQFNLSNFTRRICQQNALPLYVVWQLHESRVIPFDLFLKRKTKDVQFESSFSKQLHNLYMSGDRTTTEGLLNVFLKLLLECGYSEEGKVTADLELKKISSCIVDNFMKDVIDTITTSESSSVKCDFLQDLLADKGLQTSSLKAFVSQQISVLLKHQPISVQDAISNQHLWTFAKSPEQLTNFIKQLFLLSSPGEITQAVHDEITTEGMTGWRYTLTLISTFLLCFQDSTNIIRDLLKDMLGVCFESSDPHIFFSTILLARQAALEGPHVFSSYKDWFFSMFGDSSRSLINSRKNFLFLMKCLTDLLPYEPAYCLKAHILKPPFVPPKCRELLCDYLILAKTRLSDLNDPIDNCGMLEESEDGKISDKNKEQKLEEEIEKVLNAFENSGKIPSSVIEAHIFRKPYYLGRFLPCLLKPRPLPDKPDHRMRLIEELKRAGKLPLSTYKEYVQSCERERLQLLQGICIDDDDSMEDALMKPMDQLIYRLDQLIDTTHSDLTNNKGRQPNRKFAEILSHISEKLDYVKDVGNSSPCIADVQAPNNSSTSHRFLQQHVQVVDLLLNTVCKMVVQGEINPGLSGKQVQGFITMLSKHSVFSPVIITRISQLIQHEKCTMETHHTLGLAVTLLFIGSTSHLSEPIRLDDKHVSVQDVMDNLIGQLPCHCSQQMQFSFKFCTAYLKYCFSYFSKSSSNPSEKDCAYVPCKLIKKFAYVYSRLSCHAGPWDNSSTDFPDCLLSVTLAQNIYHSTVFKQLLQPAQMSFTEWIKEELCVDPNNDFLLDSDRKMYYLQMTHSHYIPLGVETGGCGQSYPEACKQILRCLLNSRRNGQPSPYQEHCHIHVNSTPDMKRQRNRDGIILLLQNLSLVVVNDPDVDGHSTSWLLDAMATLDSDQSTEFQSKLLFEEFMSIATSLHPSLLFSTHPRKVSCAAIERALNSIITIWKDQVLECFYLPFHLTAYLVQGLSCVFHYMPDKHVIPVLLQGCPLLLSSILMHWNRLHVVNILTSFLEVAGEDVKEELEHTRKWATRCLDMTVTDKDVRSDWLCGVSLTSIIIERKTKPTHEVWTRLFNDYPQVFSVAAQCVLYYVTWVKNYLQKDHNSENLWRVLEETLQDLVTAQPIIILNMCTNSGDHFVTNNLIRSTLKKLATVTIMRVVCRIGLTELDDIFLDHRLDLASSLLRLQVTCGQWFDGMESEANQSITELEAHPISLLELREFHSILTHLMRKLNKQEMQGLDQGLLQHCDPVIKAIVKRAML